MSILITKARLMAIIKEEIEEALDPHRPLSKQTGEYIEPGGSGLRSDTVLKTPKPPQEKPDPYPVHPSPQAMAVAMDWYQRKSPKKYKNFVRDKGPQKELDQTKRTILGAAREIDAARKPPAYSPIHHAATEPLSGVAEAVILQKYINEELEAYLEEEEKNNPWAICTDSTGREDKEKYERCVKSVKAKNKGK